MLQLNIILRCFFISLSVIRTNFDGKLSYGKPDFGTGDDCLSKSAVYSALDLTNIIGLHIIVLVKWWIMVISSRGQPIQ